LEYFCCIVVLQNALEIWFIDIGVGAVEPRKIGEKNRNFKIFAEFGGLWGKIFQRFWLGAGFLGTLIV